MIVEHWLCFERFCLLFQRAIASVYPVHEGDGDSGSRERLNHLDV